MCCPSRISRFAMRSAGPGFAAMRAASARASSISFSPGTTFDTSPQASASAASIVSPVNAISAAFDMPTARGSSHAPPSPGMMPSFTKLSANFARSPAMRMSHMHARSQPAPIAGPLTAAMVGTSRS